MGKNHRHLKKLKAEKSKTKLKTAKTKSLSKGQNVTDTNLKIKPISVQEQLVPHTGPVTSQNLDFKVIITQLNHHNIAGKVNSLQQMREYISTINSTDLRKDVLEIFINICPLFSSIEQKVRREAIKVFDKLIGIISSERTEPYFNRIASHLCCCMTHINESVQEDSLLIIDVILESIPNLLSTDCDKIIENFVMLISKVKTNANDPIMLNSFVNNEKTSIEWRLMVLVRFKKCLKAILDKKKGEKDDNFDVDKVVEVKSKFISSPIYFNPYARSINIFNEDANIDEWLDNCIKDVLPLLKDIWLEVQPEDKHSVKSDNLLCSILNKETGDVLNCILNIISYFYELTVIKCQQNQEDTIKNSSFIKISKETVTLIFEAFPFARQADNNPTDPKCLEENLTTCYLFFVFFEKTYNKDLVNQALSYLNACLLNTNYVNQEKSLILLKVLKRFYNKNVDTWSKYKETDLLQFIKNTAKYYVNCTKQEDSIEIFISVCEHVELIEEDFFKVVQKACKTLLSPKIDQKTFKVIRQVVLQEVIEIQIVLSVLLPKILGNIDKIEIEGALNENYKICSILALYKYVPLNERNVQYLTEFGDKSPCYLETIQGVIEKSQI